MKEVAQLVWMGERWMLLSALAFLWFLSSTPAFDYQCPMILASLENSVQVKGDWLPHRYLQGCLRSGDCLW